MSDILETILQDTHGLLSSVESLASAHILKDDESDLEGRVSRKIGTANPESGKGGLLIVCLFPEVSESERNLPGPPVTVKVEVQIIEHVMFNRSGSGTGIRSSVAALRVLGALHQHHAGGYLVAADKNPVTKIPVKEGFVSHAVTVFARFDLPAVDRPAGVDVSINVSSEVVLTCATDGAAIWYSTDGEYPTPGGGSTLYTVPFASPATGTVIRAAAYKEGLNPGDVLQFTVTA